MVIGVQNQSYITKNTRATKWITTLILWCFFGISLFDIFLIHIYIYIYIPLEVLQENINMIIKNEFIIPPKTPSIYQREIEWIIDSFHLALKIFIIH
jgi:hypothetical protein